MCTCNLSEAKTRHGMNKYIDIRFINTYIKANKTTTKSQPPSLYCHTYRIKSPAPPPPLGPTAHNSSGCSAGRSHSTHMAPLTHAPEGSLQVDHAPAAGTADSVFSYLYLKNKVKLMNVEVLQQQ